MLSTLQKGGKIMRKLFVMAAAFVVLCMPFQAFSQAGNASLSGTITDASGAVLPGVTVTATNIGTNVTSSTKSNTAGVYNFPSLQPGTYRVSAEMAGFQTYTNTNVQLGTSRQIRLNFQLEVGKIEQQVEVNVAADTLLLESSSSVGSVLPEEQVSDLPLVSNNALDLIKVMGGVVMGNNPVWDVDNTAFAGVKAADINVQRDGVTMNDVRYPTGINSPTRLNPDLVGEFRMVLSPVDAELGRGGGQVQVLTRSGSNEYHGSLVWNIRNSALDANYWYNNTRGITPPWSNQHEYTISLGGPIIKNKTFFYALWNQQITRQRVPISPVVLTPCAQRGIFRYYDNWNNGNINQITTTGGNGTVRVVRDNGTPTAEAIPYLNPSDPSSGPHNGILRYASLFHPLMNTPTAPDCSDAVFDTSASTWDAFRTQRDPTGWIDGTFLDLMPLPPNNYEVGDGLNTAGYRWNRTLQGGANLWGVGEDNQRKQINIKIDHNFSSAHRVSGSWSYDRLWADDSYTNWPTGYGGVNKFKPQVLTVVLTSTLKPTLLNEARFGMTRTGTNVYAPIDTPGSAEKLKPLFPEYNGQTVLIGPGSAGSNFAIQSGLNSHFYGTSGLLPVGFRDTSPRWSVADAITWTRGRHSFKGGGEVRIASSESITKGNWFAGTTLPYVAGGSAGGAAMNFNPAFPGMAGDSNTAGTNRQNAEGLLNFLSGSIGSALQYYFINSPTQTSWNDPLTEQEKIRTFHQNEFDLFFKDDWKVTDDLTLNLGVRYEYYGVPHLGNGLTASWTGGGYDTFGPGGGFSNWFVPGAGDPDFRTGVTFVGPDSPNPDQKVYEKDLNNFGPAVGFAWQLPFLGKGKTTIRGGYQLSYLTSGRVSNIVDIMGEAPGMSYSSTWSGQDWGSGYYPYLDLTMLSAASPVPIMPGVEPLTAIPITDRSATMTAFDPNLRTPYIQTVTLAVTRNVTSNFTVDVRYVGTFSRKLAGSLNLDVPNFLTNDLIEAFDAARSGGESELLDQMFQGLPGFTGSGAQFLRTAFIWAPSLGPFGGGFTPASTNLATGNYQGLANTLNAANGANFVPCGGNGCLLRNGGFPENFIKTNPQFNNSNLYSNWGSANYQGFQAQFTLRPTHGLSFQGTYTWSRNLGYDTSAGFTDPRDRRADYSLLSTHRSHTFTTYGTFDLPFGPNRALLNSNNGVLSRIVGGWQLSWIGNATTGIPASLAARSALYGRGTPDQVGPFDPKSAGVYWKPGALAGNVFGDRYTYVPDPQCSDVAPSLQASCNNALKAVADAATGQIIFQNPLPGHRGTAGLSTLAYPNTWNVDMALSKAFRITEGKNLSVRIEAANVFNHAQESGGSDAATRRTTQRADTPSAPNFDINNVNPFGYLGTKVGYRMFQAKVRFDF
jgi:hypothetical protein